VAFGVQNHSLQSFGDAIGTIAFGFFTQPDQSAVGCRVEVQEAWQHGYSQYATPLPSLSFY